MNCLICGSEVNTAGCSTPWKHSGVGVPGITGGITFGPLADRLSDPVERHRMDLAERAALDAELARLKAALAALQADRDEACEIAKKRGAERDALRAALDESELDHRRAVDSALAAKEAAEQKCAGLRTCPQCDGEWLLNVEGEPCPFCRAKAAERERDEAEKARDTYADRWRSVTAECDSALVEKEAAQRRHAHMFGVNGTLLTAIDGLEAEITRLKEEIVHERRNTDNCRGDASRMGDRALAAESATAALRERAKGFEVALLEIVDRASGDVRVDGLTMATPQRVEQSIREALAYVSEPARSLLAAAPPHEET